MTGVEELLMKTVSTNKLEHNHDNIVIIIDNSQVV